MGKKIWYSSPLNLYWREVYRNQKGFTPYLSDDQIYNVLKHKNARIGLTSKTGDNRESFLIGLEMWWQDYNKNLLHVFFLDRQLRDYLEAMLLPDLSGISRYLLENGDSRTVTYLMTKTKVNCVMYCYGIHIPYETEGYAFQFSVYDNGSVELAFFQGKVFGALTDKMYSDLLKKDDKQSRRLVRTFRLAVNTIAYMRCFPECVVEGVPRITIDREESRTDKNVKLGISAKVADNDVAGTKTRPHFRKGHFRILRSDFYKNRQGDLIFIHETMVNGKAKTVYTASNLDSVQDFDASETGV